ncbi:fibronectin type III domain-containing protein [Streptosporangium sp. NPDC001681]|uniref:fibronectin type III domain-containing protein n=1 Tax=Streptosporangium sp. NPDC001681 TaxID=3154395 RepID=UPI00331D2126
MIIPGEPVRYGLRLVVYAPNGPRLGVLPHPLGFEAAFPLDDVSSLKVSYSAHAVGAGLLAQPCEIAVEWSTGGAWVEPADGRFLRIKRGTDHTDRTGVFSYDCPGYSWQLRKVVLYPHAEMIEGKRQFAAVSAGAILRTFVDEGQGRGAVPGLSVDFDEDTDSAGEEWDKALTLALEPGVPLLTMLINLADQGVINWRMSGRVLQVFNEGTEMAVDQAAGAAPVDLRLGRDVDQAPDDATLEDAASSILIVGEGGLNVEVTNPAALVPWGRWETHQTQGGVSDTVTMTLLGQSALERAARERVQLTRGIIPHLARWLPFSHYGPGDYVLAPGDGAVMAPLRIRQITLSVGKDGELAGNLVLNDRFLEADIRRARQAAGILAGGVGSGGSGAEPAPDSSGRVPAAPVGLIVGSVAYLDTAGYAQGLATVTWSPVIGDVNGVALGVDGYEVYARRNLEGQLWVMVAQTASGDTSATVSPLVVGWEYGFKVRAINDGTKGLFSAVTVKLMPDDATPPPVPSAPELSTRLGVIHVAWDGLGSAAEPMPSDFERTRVWMQDPLAPGAVVVGSLDAAGSVVIPGQPYGADREIWLTSVDRSGNESDESEHEVIATVALVDTDVIGQVIDGAEHIISGSIPADAKIVAGSITAALIQALAIQAGHISANAVTADTIAAGAIQAGHIAANAVTANTIAAGAITAAKIDANAIDGKTITGAHIRTAATGRRLELAPPGATYPQMRFHPASGSNYTRLQTRNDLFPGEATFEITSGTNSGGTAASQTTIAAGYMQMQVRDAALDGDNGGLMELTESYALYGYMHNASDEQYFWFDSSGRTRHVGKWWDYAALGPTAGVLAGSKTTSPASSGGNWDIVGYGATMIGNMGPVCVIRRGLSSPSTHVPNGSWYVVESNQSSFRIHTSWPDGFAIYWWSHRH